MRFLRLQEMLWLQELLMLRSNAGNRLWIVVHLFHLKRIQLSEMNVKFGQVNLGHKPTYTFNTNQFLKQ